MASHEPRDVIRSRRMVLPGIVLLGAAVILWLALRREETPMVTAEVVAIAPREDLISGVTAAESTTHATETAVPTPLGGFTVHLRTLQYDATDGLVLARVNEYHAAFADGLRAVPRLHLVAEQASPDFRVTISNPDSADPQQTSLPSEWVAKSSVEILSSQGSTSGPVGTVYVLGMVGDAWRGRAPAGVDTRGPLSGYCENPRLMPCSPAEIAKRQVMALRKKVFPHDGTLERELEARIFDTTLPKRERDLAIGDALSMKMTLSNAMVNEVLARIALPQEAGDRGNLLAMLAGQRRPEVVPPLIRVVRYDSDIPFRIEAVRLLAADFPNDPAVRAVLDDIAADPSNPTLQENAKVVLDGLSGN